MFIGHFAVGFAAKRWAPKVSLGILFVSVQLLDLLWPFFLAAGLERVTISPGDTAFTPLRFDHYPWTHSLVAACLWAVAFMAAYYFRAGTKTTSLVLGVGVLSHWILDAITHRPDLPLSPGSSARIGLGMWNSVPATVIAETILFAAAVVLYSRATRPRDRTGRYGMAALVAFLLVVYASNLLGPPPPDTRSLIFVCFALWLLPLWAWWIDRHRESV